MHIHLRGRRKNRRNLQRTFVSATPCRARVDFWGIFGARGDVEGRSGLFCSLACVFEEKKCTPRENPGYAYVSASATKVIIKVLADTSDISAKRTSFTVYRCRHKRGASVPCQRLAGRGAYWAGRRPLFAPNGQAMMFALPHFTSLQC